jgi:hypothetical protein
MGYMGFYDLFEHLLGTGDLRDKHAIAAKTSLVPKSRFSKQPELTRSNSKTALQACKSYHLETGLITSRCDKCHQLNDISLSLFVGLDYKFKSSAMAICQKCNTDYIVTLDESRIQ